VKITVDVQNTILLGGRRSGPVNCNVTRVNIAAMLHAQLAMAHCCINALSAAIALGLTLS